jgi:hypothetical protein
VISVAHAKYVADSVAVCRDDQIKSGIEAFDPYLPARVFCQGRTLEPVQNAKIWFHVTDADFDLAVRIAKSHDSTLAGDRHQHAGDSSTDRVRKHCASISLSAA